MIGEERRMDQRAIRPATPTGAASHDAVPSLLIFRRKVVAFYRWQSHGLSLNQICVGCIRLKTAIQGPCFVVEYSEWMKTISRRRCDRARLWSSLDKVIRRRPAIFMLRL